MIRNIVFDIGNVLVRFEPEKYLRTFVDSDDEAQQLKNLIYLSTAWRDGDLGKASRRNTINRLCKQYPEKEAVLRQALRHCSEILLMPQGTPVLLEKLRQSGFQLFYLSNTNPADFAFMTKKYPLLRGMRGIASFQEGVLKPDAAIFHLLLQRFELQAEECLFIDDMPVNTKAASALGFQTITLPSADALEQALCAYLDLDQCAGG